MGYTAKENAPKKQFNFGVKAQGAGDDINSKIQLLGFSKQTTVNELAARGVQISIRDQLILKLKEEEDKRVQEVADDLE